MSVQSIINSLEDKHNIDILYMNELGSKAFNLDSNASDHDAYVVFRQPLNEYAKINGYTQNIMDHKSYDNWDIQGWNIKRFAELMYKSNPTTIEFINSPLKLYSKNDEFKFLLDDFRNYVINNVNPIGLYYHYQSLAKKNYEKYIKENWKINKEEIEKTNMGKYLDTMNHSPRIIDDNGGVKLSFGRAGSYPIEQAYNRDFVRKTTTDRTIKRTLFIVRAVCCAKWVKHNKNIPPLDFEVLLNEETYLDKTVKNEIENIVSKKRNNNNESVGVILPEFIEGELNTKIDNEKYNKGNLDKDRVNKFITDTLNL